LGAPRGGAGNLDRPASRATRGLSEAVERQPQVALDGPCEGPTAMRFLMGDFRVGRADHCGPNAKFCNVSRPFKSNGVQLVHQARVCADWRWCLRPDYDFCQSLKRGNCKKQPSAAKPTSILPPPVSSKSEARPAPLHDRGCTAPLGAHNQDQHLVTPGAIPSMIPLLAAAGLHRPRCRSSSSLLLHAICQRSRPCLAPIIGSNASSAEA
jgi:hypothetical protein